jgi:hypothetical protein
LLAGFTFCSGLLVSPFVEDQSCCCFMQDWASYHCVFRVASSGDSWVYVGSILACPPKTWLHSSHLRWIWHRIIPWAPCKDQRAPDTACHLRQSQGGISKWLWTHLGCTTLSLPHPQCREHWPNPRSCYCYGGYLANLGQYICLFS